MTPDHKRVKDLSKVKTQLCVLEEIKEGFGEKISKEEDVEKIQTLTETPKPEPPKPMRSPLQAGAIRAGDAGNISEEYI